MREDNVNLITAGTRLEGTIEFQAFTRFEGLLQGTLKGAPQSELILGENAVVEGKIMGDVVIIDGFVRGDIVATSKVVITETGRVIGEIDAPNVAIKFGAYFDGKCAMSSLAKNPENLESSRT
jgi:cytoskeletal protein CcmA (bactofilin family)